MINKMQSPAVCNDEEARILLEISRTRHIGLTRTTKNDPKNAKTNLSLWRLPNSPKLVISSFLASLYFESFTKVVEAGGGRGGGERRRD